MSRSLPMQATLKTIYATTTTDHAASCDVQRPACVAKEQRPQAQVNHRASEPSEVLPTDNNGPSLMSLPVELMSRILELVTPLRARSLVVVCHECRRLWDDEEAWRQRLITRFNLRPSYKAKMGSPTFKALFRVWHEARRLPALPNDPIFARVSSKQLMNTGLLVGVTVMASNDCRCGVNPDTGKPYLRLKIVMQAVDDYPVTVDLSSMQVHLKRVAVPNTADGLTTDDTWHKSSSVDAVDLSSVTIAQERRLHLHQHSPGMAEFSALHSTGDNVDQICLAYGDFVVLVAHVPFEHLNDGALHEPAALEQCDVLSVNCWAPKNSCALQGSSNLSSQSVLRVQFNEELIWAIYEQVNSNFYTFNSDRARNQATALT